MDFRYIKSVVYLVTFGGLGYTLFKLSAPSENDIEAIKRVSTLFSNKFHV